MKRLLFAMISIGIVIGAVYLYKQQNEPAQPVYAAVQLPTQATVLRAEEELLQEVLVPVPSQLILINRSANRLAFFEDGRLVKEYRIATGKRGTPTPSGAFPIVNKVKNRPYYKESIPGGDPRNPLGDRWMGLGVGSTAGNTYAIHGNSNSASIGYHVSSGCIRMYNEDVRALFEQVNVGTMVIIADMRSSWKETALQYGYRLYG